MSHTLRLTALTGLVACALVVSFAGSASANGSAFFKPAGSNEKVDLVYFGKIKGTRGQNLDFVECEISDGVFEVRWENDRPGHYRSPDIGKFIKGYGAPVDPKAAISGTIELPAAQRAHVAPADVVFLVARRIADNPQARGTLVAVKRLSAASFPIQFTLSARDMMVPTGAFDGEVSLAVRVDKDGDPMTRRKGDVFGSLPKVSVGARGVKLTLDQVQKEDESLAGGGAPMGSPHGGMPPGHP